MTQLHDKINVIVKNKEIHENEEKKIDINSTVIKEKNNEEIISNENVLDKNDLKKDKSADKQNNKLKCNLCNRKIKLTESLYCKCKCGMTFCCKHRFAGMLDSDNSHNCKYDYMESFKKDLTLSNPKIVQNKVEKI